MSRVRLFRTLLLALLVTAPLVAAEAWRHDTGGAGRSGVAVFAERPLDVVQHFALVGEDGGRVHAFALLETPHGLAGFGVVGDERCVLVTVPDLDRPAPRVRDLFPCELTVVAAYDPVLDALVGCALQPDGSSPLVAAVRVPDAQLLWTRSAFELTGMAGGASCFYPAVDTVERAVYVAVSSSPSEVVGVGRNYGRVARLDLDDGRVRWSRALEPFATATGRALLPTEVEAPTATFRTSGVTVTDSGLVVAGYTQCVCRKGDLSPMVTSQGTVYWLTKDGDIVGGRHAEDAYLVREGATPSRVRYGSNFATSNGPLGAFALGGDLLLVNPAERDPVASVRIQAVESSLTYWGITGPAWWDETLLVPLSHSVTAYDTGTLQPRWSWTEGPEWDATRVYLSPPGDAYVLNAKVADLPDATSRGPTTLVRLDVQTGDVLQRLPLPVEGARGDGRWLATLQPLSGGRAVLSAFYEQEVVVLGPADPALVAGVVASSLYPAQGETVTLAFAPQRGGPAPERLLVAWGDGRLDESAPGDVASHRYAGAGARVVRVTAVHEDGRTGTAELVVRVGATPPPDTFLARAFAADNQDMTFGVLGVGLTVLGGGYALLARRRRKSVLDRELHLLEDIRARGATDPVGAVGLLEEFRARTLVDLRAGRLDDSQFSVVELRVSRLLQSLRLRLVRPFAGRVSDEFLHLVEAALEDGRVTEAEAQELLDALGREPRLTSGERERFASLIATWTRSDAA